MNRAQLPNARLVGSLPRHESPFAKLARAAKVEKLVSAIDQHARDIDLDPITNAAAVIRSVIDLLDERGWRGVADDAKCNVPSATTIAAVRRVYEQRAEQADEDPFARFS